jgi:hypothetical protein
MVDRLSIFEEMKALDLKDRDFYVNLTSEEKKKFSTYLMIRWGSSVEGSADLQAYYLQATNERLNKNFFSIPKVHDKLNWLSATTISPGMGTHRHNWIKTKSKETNNKIQKFLQKLYPFLKADELQLLESINDPKIWKEMAKDLGYTPEQIKKEF